MDVLYKDFLAYLLANTFYIHYMILSFLESLASLSFLVISDNIITIIIITTISISIGISVRVSIFLFRKTPVAATLVWMVEPVKLDLPGTDFDANVPLVTLEISVRRLVCIHKKYKNLSHVLFDLDLNPPDASDFRITFIKLSKMRWWILFLL